MVGLAEGDAGAAAGDEARIDRVEAAKEGRGPRCLACGVCDGSVVLGNVVGAGYPVVHVLLHLGFGGSHCAVDGLVAREVLERDLSRSFRFMEDK